MAKLSSTQTKITLGLVALMGTGIVALGASRISGMKPAASVSSSSASTTSTSTAAAANATYKDGTYSATGSYDSPGGQESIKISLTLKDNIVTATSASSESNSFQSKEYQDEFISGYKSLVIGKKITDIQLSKVSGSSLTSEGFNDAVQQIEAQAQA